MKNGILGAAVAAALAVSAPALAADMPVKAAPVVAPVTTWGGFYFGGGVGGAWDHPTSWTFPFAPAIPPMPVPGASSWAVALHTGTNWQFGHLVLGTELDYIFTDLKSNGVCPSSNICQQRAQNIYTFGGRAGFAWNDWMLYGGGGYAGVGIELNVFSKATGAFADGGNHWHSGWYAGGGLEWAWTPSIHFSIDYKHINANTAQHATAPISFDDRVVGDKIDLVMARVAFRLWEGSWGPFSK